MEDFQVLSRRQIEFGIWIRNYRRAHELSLDQFARIIGQYAGTTPTAWSVNRWETFQAIPSEKYMKAVLAAIQITINDLDN